jgi:hypothetical protein
VDVVGHGRLGQDQRHVARFERLPKDVGVVELRDPNPAGHAPAESALNRQCAAVFDIDESFFEVTVVVPLKQDDHLAIGDGARQADRFGVRLCGR